MIKMKNGKLQKWIVLIMVALIGGMISKLPYLKDSYYSALLEASGATNTQLGLILTAYGIMNTIVYIPGGFLADKFSPKKLIVISCFGTAIIGFWYATLPGFGSLVIIHALFGITTIFTFWASMVKITNNLGKYDEQGKMFGLLESGRGLVSTVFGFAAAAVFTHYVDDILGLRGVIIFWSVLLALDGILAILFIEDPEKIEGNAIVDDGTKMRWEDMKAVIKIPRVWLAGIVIACNYTANLMFGYVVPYLADGYGVDSSTVAFIGVFRANVLMFLGSIVAGVFADKLKSVIKFWTYGFIGMSAVAFLYLLIPTNRSMTWIVIVNLMLQGTFILAVKAMYFAVIDELNINKRLAGTASGLLSIVGYAPEMFAFTLAGSLIDNNPGVLGYHKIFILIGVFSILGLILAFVLKKVNSQYNVEIQRQP